MSASGQTYRDRPGSLLFDLRLDILASASSVGILRLWWFGNVTVHCSMRGDQFTFSTVPLRKNLSGRCAAQDTRVDEARKTNVRNMSRRAEYALEVPYGLGSRANGQCRSSKKKKKKHQQRKAVAYASGYNSSRNPPPFCLWNTPVNPQG